jgi:hypothetical protein
LRTPFSAARVVYSSADACFLGPADRAPNLMRADAVIYPGFSMSLPIKAKLPFPVHAHMLRHAAGYTLANAGKDTRSCLNSNRPFETELGR